MNEDFFKSKRALVVGGSGGIGREISLSLARAGASVFVHGGHASKKFDFLMQELNSISKNEIQFCGEKHSSLILDFEKFDFEEFENLKISASSKNSKNEKSLFQKKIEKNFYPPLALKSALARTQILCLCYGPFLQKPLSKTAAREWLFCSTQNFALPGVLASFAARFMKKRGFGRILFFGGTRTFAVRAFKTNAAYAAAKTAVASLAKSFALEFGKFGVATNAIFPGFVQTEYVSSAQKKRYEKLLGAKMISARSVADAALFLLSNSDFNGNLLEIDRGWQP